MKSGLRAAFLRRRAALSPEERRRQSRTIVERLEGLRLHASGGVVVGYHPMDQEVDVVPFLEMLVGRGIRVALPRVDGRALVLHAWAPGEALERSSFGVLEPSRRASVVEPDEVVAALVPGVAFDLEGHRLGFGQGFYDRFLVGVPRPGRVGVAFDLQVVPALPREAHDVPMGWLVTPGAARRFSG